MSWRLIHEILFFQIQKTLVLIYFHFGANTFIPVNFCSNDICSNKKNSFLRLSDIESVRKWWKMPSERMLGWSKVVDFFCKTWPTYIFIHTFFFSEKKTFKTFNFQFFQITESQMEHSLSSGANPVNLFTAVIYEFSGAPFLGRPLALPTNIRLGWKVLPGANTLAYYTNS
jgi:hypothetical protein